MPSSLNSQVNCCRIYVEQYRGWGGCLASPRWKGYCRREEPFVGKETMFRFRIERRDEVGCILEVDFAKSPNMKYDLQGEGEGLC